MVFSEWAAQPSHRITFPRNCSIAFSHHETEYRGRHSRLRWCWHIGTCASGGHRSLPRRRTEYYSGVETWLLESFYFKSRSLPKPSSGQFLLPATAIRNKMAPPDDNATSQMTVVFDMTSMTKLSPSVYLYCQEGSRSTVNSTAPQPILLATWMDARDVHISKYIARYQTLHPTACILLINSFFHESQTLIPFSLLPF